MFIKEILLKQRGNNKIAIKFRDETITYDQLLNHSEKLAKRLKVNNVYSKHIALFIPNSIQYVISYFGIAFCDKVIVPVSILEKKREIQSTLKYCEVNLIITDSSNINNLKEMLSDMIEPIHILNVDSYEIFTVNGDEKRICDKEEHVDCDLTNDDIAIMIHTSGTTSNPKRVMLSHRNLISNINSNIESLQLNSSDISLIQLPMIFGYCNTAQLLTHLYLGATIIIMHTMFVPKQFFQIVEKEKITNFTTVPSVLLLLLQYKNKTLYDYSSLRYICFGGGIMPVDKLRELITTFPSVGFVQTYGQTEAAPRVACLMPKDALRKIGSVGKPIPNVRVKIVNEFAKDASPNEIGEIIVQGENVMKGYYKRPEETNRILRDGWLYTGDLAKYDEEHYIYLVGRKKNVIISGGMNIYPEELEEVLMKHPSIKEVIVLKENHELLGEVPIAKVVLHEDVRGNEDILRDINKHCHSQLARFKVPSKILIEENLDKTITGKIKRC
jgi:long-chain acyl-CoA synthetase